jgi:hypothetical protein
MNGLLVGIVPLRAETRVCRLRTGSAGSRNMASCGQLNEPQRRPGITSSDAKSDDKRLVFEFMVYCTGSCGPGGNKRVFRLYQDKTFECNELVSGDPLSEARDSILVANQAKVSPTDFDQMLGWLKSVDFERAGDGELPHSLVDAVYVTVIRRIGDKAEETITLKNHNPPDDSPLAKLGKKVRALRCD